jgi:hypothetical protein
MDVLEEYTASIFGYNSKITKQTKLQQAMRRQNPYFLLLMAVRISGLTS